MLKVGDKLLCKKTVIYFTILRMDEFIIDIWINDDNDLFSLNKNSEYYIWDYFYTPQEVRKMKLERLKQC